MLAFSSFQEERERRPKKKIFRVLGEGALLLGGERIGVLDCGGRWGGRCKRGAGRGPCCEVGVPFGKCQLFLQHLVISSDQERRQRVYFCDGGVLLPQHVATN